MQQTSVIKLACPNCGSSLNISHEMERFACSHCGTQQIVERSGSVIHLKAITDSIKRVQYGTDKTAAELALKRLPIELQQLNDRKIQIRVHYNQIIEKKRKNLLLATILVGIPMFFILIAITLNLLKVILDQEIAGLLSLSGSLTATLTSVFFVRRYLSKLQPFDVMIIKEQKEYDLSSIRPHIQDVESKIRENYNIANS